MSSYWPAREPVARHVGRLTSPAISTEMTSDAVLCLPIGSYEQHGPHLPIYTDTILAEGFAFAAVDRWGDTYNAWALPTIPYGLAREHKWAAGAVSFSVRVFSDMLLGICAELADSFPARNLLVVNGHGGNRGILEALVYEIKDLHGINACITHPTALAKVPSGSLLPEVHGGMSETSVMLALAPTEVFLDRLPDSYAPDPSLAKGARDLILDRGVTWPWTSNDPAIGVSGLIGDARQANLELGRKIVDSATEAYGPVLARLVERR
ncbi:creatininase family protein [Parafrankia discariae]|uniref:creatininase family protein n=1 Tax=Parafrankia discariae TaxID=365528 RepID=UPI000399EBD7|nr:creatininase family protein [Parafrankia discariae]